jgi:hypothetical protein
LEGKAELKLQVSAEDPHTTVRPSFNTEEDMSGGTDSE